MIPFNVYLRKYVMISYNKINDKNSTDSDYTLLLRKLPDNVTSLNIK